MPLGDNYLLLPAASIQKGRSLSQQQSVRDSDEVDLLTRLQILQGDQIDMDEIVKYVHYDKNEEEGTFEEVEKYDAAYVPLGYDTQLQKANLYMIR